MIKLFAIVITAVLTSLYYFPFEFLALQGVNTKMMLAVLGLVCLVFYVLKDKELSMPRELLYLVLLASGVSLASLISITINQTPDNAYVNYITSFSVWLSGAFAICMIIKILHGGISVRLVLNYLIFVCLFQCVSALWIDNSPSLALFVDNYLDIGQDLAVKIKRLYGFGALLDTAGMKFSLVLVGIAFYLAEIKESLSLFTRNIYIISFIAIVIIGNMIARTTLVGAGIGMIFITISFFVKMRGKITASQFSPVFSWIWLIALGIVVSVILYNTNSQAKRMYRFAFEGFFSLAEKGEWEVSSNEVLKTMIVFPETLHTWVIGDAYFENPRNDKNYLGDTIEEGFYMGIDIGYLRFIFYFGIFGLIMMMGVIIYSTVVCIKYFKNERWLFILALIVGLTVWFKVSTDIFCFLALFLSAAALKEPEESTPKKLKNTLILNKDLGRKISARSGIV